MAMLKPNQSIYGIEPDVAMSSLLSSLRVVRDGDAAAMSKFVGNLSAKSRRFRFHGAINGCAPNLLRGMTQVDGVRHVALVACIKGENGDEIIGEARYCLTNPEGTTCGLGDDADFAIAVADSCHGGGVADQLLTALMHAAGRAGVVRLHGDVLDGNTRMVGFLRRNGFDLDPSTATAWGMSRWQRAVVPDPRPSAARRLAQESGRLCVSAGVPA
jgi:GNAT superfamily N-acetyltransferase